MKIQVEAKTCNSNGTKFNSSLKSTIKGMQRDQLQQHANQKQFSKLKC
jgi:hypothetical protein